ncbi:FMN-binding protein [Anaerotignum sp.]
MGSTKFVVVKAKELVKTAVFAVLGVIIIVGLITFFLNMGKDEDTGLYRDGTYYGEMNVGQETAEIAVTVEDGAIADISMEEPDEAVAAFYPLLETAAEEVGREVVATQSLTIEVDPENAHSAQLVLNAIAEGLEQAKK